MIKTEVKTKVIQGSILLGMLISFASGLFANETIFRSGFESGISSEWGNSLSTGMPVFERNVLSKFSGEFGFQMKFSDAVQKGNLETPHSIPWENGASYNISFYYKTIEPSDNSNTNIKVFDAAGTKLDQINFTLTSTNWVKYTTTITGKTDGASGYVLFSIRPNNSGTGEFYFDDFTIEKVVLDPGFFNDLKTKTVSSDPNIKWVQFGPGMSGNNKCAIWHPTDPNRLFIGPNMGNSYYSADKGLTYHTILNEDESGYREGTRGPVDFFSMDFSRQNPDFGMCSDERNQGIFVSQNRGVNWQNMEAPEFEGRYVSCVTVDPQNDNVWYAGGGQMRNLGNNLFPLSQERGTMVDAGSLNKLWKTTDKGKTWTLKNAGFHPETQFETILVDPQNSGTIYATTNYGFYKSTDSGESWTKKTNGFDYDVKRAMTSHYDNTTDVLTLFVICNPMWKVDGQTITDSAGGIFKSIDRGESWVKISGNLALDMRQWQNTSDIKTSYMHCAANVFGMSDAEFQEKYPNMPSKITNRFNTIAVDPNDVNNIYLNNEYSNASRNNFKPGQLWRTKDGGTNWYVALRNGKAWKAGSSDYQYWVTRGNPMETNISMRYLKEWVDRDNYDRKACNFVRFNADGTALHTQMAKISLMSYDKGETWVDIDDEYTTPGTDSYVGAGNSNVPGHGFYQNPAVPDKVFCSSGENSLWVTNDEGEKVRAGAQGATSYRLLDEETSLSCYAIHPQNTNIHYALFFRQAAKGKLLKSTDNGETWDIYGTPIPAWEIEANSGDQSVHQLSLIIDRDQPNNMYFCVPKSTLDLCWVGNSVTGFGIHKSTDGGLNWTTPNTGLPASLDVSRLVFSSNSCDTLYATVVNSGGGLYRSADRGENWLEVESTRSISGNYGINDIHFAVDGKAYITAGYKNEGIKGGGLWVSSDRMKTWKLIFDFPWVNRVEVAPWDTKTILISTLPNNATNNKNPGLYLSKDSGENWIKINKGNGQSDRVNDIAIDNYRPGVYYSSTYGSGWYVARDSTAEKIITAESLNSPSEMITVGLNKHHQIETTIKPVDATFKNLIWSSGNEAVATVNSAGLVSGKSIGTCYVKAILPPSNLSIRVKIIVDESSSSDLLNNEYFKVFPNPGSGKIHLNYSGNCTNGVLSVYSLSGKRLLKQSIPEGNSSASNQVSLDGFQSGMYILEIKSNEKKLLTKFILN